MRQNYIRILPEEIIVIVELGHYIDLTKGSNYLSLQVIGLVVKVKPSVKRSATSAKVISSQ
jgi:hypothetical protein